MAVEQNITEADGLFTGEDKTLKFTIVDDQSVPVNVASWAMKWTLRKKPADADPPVLEKTTAAAGGITVTGVYNVDPAQNTQRVEVVIAAADLQGADVGSDNVDGTTHRTWAHALKRTDDGSGTVLAYGSVYLQRAAAH